MTSHMPPVPPGNQTTKGPRAGSDAGADALRDTFKGHGEKGHGESQNPSEQGDTANVRQNTTNAGFFKGRRVK